MSISFDLMSMFFLLSISIRCWFFFFFLSMSRFERAYFRFDSINRHRIESPVSIIDSSLTHGRCCCILAHYVSSGSEWVIQVYFVVCLSCSKCVTFVSLSRNNINLVGSGRWVNVVFASHALLSTARVLLASAWASAIIWCSILTTAAACQS